MKYLLLTCLLALSTFAKAAKIAGVSDLKVLPHAGAYQSILDASQEVGFGKPIWHLEDLSTNQPLLNIGLFGGVKINDAGAPIINRNSMNAGPTLQLPGSSLDWLLGTKMGATWLPKAKAGIYAGDNWLRPQSIKLMPNFIGFGITYPVFGGS